MKKNLIVVTGGAGFIGYNLISLLIEKTHYRIISIDNYSSGSLKNHIKNKKIKYIKSETKNISKILNNYKKNIHSLFHFGEFSRIYQSFLKMNDCIESNTVGTNAVFNFCLQNKIKLIYSATSASIGNKGEDKNLSPYAFTKAKNLEMLENLKKWFKLKFEVIYFYNVYGPKQVDSGSMATVIGIFEKQFEKKNPLTIVKPGSQARRFTHVIDTVQACYYAWKKNKCRHYSISSKRSYSILEVAKMFDCKVKFLSPRKGERYASALTNMNLSNKVYKIFGKINLKDYVANIVKNSEKNN
jgi:UDP-glucose 4-epimerase